MQIQDLHDAPVTDIVLDLDEARGFGASLLAHLAVGLVRLLALAVLALPLLIVWLSL